MLVGSVTICSDSLHIWGRPIATYQCQCLIINTFYCVQSIWLPTTGLHTPITKSQAWNWSKYLVNWQPKFATTELGWNVLSGNNGFYDQSHLVGLMVTEVQWSVTSCGTTGDRNAVISHFLWDYRWQKCSDQSLFLGVMVTPMEWSVTSFGTNGDTNTVISHFFGTNGDRNSVISHFLWDYRWQKCSDHSLLVGL